jgi:polyhydroxybutyrate depolymerase
MGLRCAVASALASRATALLLIAAALSACSKAQPKRSRTGPPAVTASGCGAPGQRGGDFKLQINDGNGSARDYEVIVPEPVDPDKRLALTFVYHGAGGTIAAAKSFGLQNAAGAAQASIFVFPQGIPYQSFGVGWDDACDGYDMVLFDQLLAKLSAQYCIDEKAVFAAGFSWGGDHVTALSCCRGDRIAAIAGASCTDEFADAAKASTYNNLPCPAAGHSAIRFTFDPAGDQAYKAQYFSSTAELYRSFNACSTATTAAESGPCLSFDGCTKPFVECPYPGLGHQLPPNWASDTWSFFSSVR